VDRPSLTAIGLCSGVGMLDIGLAAGLEYLGFGLRSVAHVEREAFPITILGDRGEQKALDDAPVYPDLTRFDGRPFRGVVDIIHGGFPCQPWSAAGQRKGTDDDRWIWPDIVRIVSEVEPGICFFENVPGLISGGGLEHCLFDLAQLGFDAEWQIVSAAAVGASHKRERVFILAIHQSRGFGILRQSSGGGGFADRGNEELDNTMCGRHGRQEEKIRARRNGVINAGDSRLGNTGLKVTSRTGGNAQPESAINGDCIAGGELGNTNQIERQRDPAAGRQTIAGAEYGCDQLADTKRMQPEQHEGQRSGSGETDGAGASGEFAGHGVPLAHTSSTRPQGREQRGTCNTDRGGAQAHGSVSELCGTFAPGPTDSRWPGIIERYPERAPALESGVRVLADGAAVALDESRSNQLRAIGNGCVPSAVAVGFVTLARRAGIT